MKRILSVVLSVVLLGTGFLTGLSAMAESADQLSNEGRRVDVGYLLRESFPSTPFGAPGWTYHNTGLGTNNVTNVITDDSKTQESYITKSFIKQTDAVITLEFKILQVSDISGGLLKLRNGDADAVVVEINNGNELQYLDQNGEKRTIGRLDRSTWVGIKMVCDIPAKKVSLMIDGIRKGTFAFTDDQSAIDNLLFGVSGPGTGVYSLGTVAVYKGFAIHEDLISASPTVNSFLDGNMNLNAAVRTMTPGGVEDNNNADTPLGVDGDVSTAWKANSNYQTKDVAYIVEYKGKIAKFNKVVFDTPEEYKGDINISYLQTNGNWGTVEYVSNTTFGTGEKAYTKKYDQTFYAQTVAITFSVIPEGYIPQVGEFQVYYEEDAGAGETNSYVIPEDWNLNAEGGSAEVYEYNAYQPEKESNVFRLIDTAADRTVTISKEFSLAGSLIANFELCLPQKADGFGAVLSHESGKTMQVYTKGDDIVFQAGDMSPVTIVKGYIMNNWYKFQLEYDASVNTVLVETNGFSIADTVTVDTSFASGSFTNIAFATSDAAKGILMADAVKVKPPVTRKSVPTPMPLDTGKDILTMQVCTLWREGTHLGWSALDTEETMGSKPLLGWYDEGDPEVADWEIKYAVEHGINNFMYCWYRRDVGGGPIKETTLDDQMWEGYFNAEYKDMINFSIMFTNHSPTRIYSEQDMLENLMPYWIETFFKNPNYLKTSDNKPILYIYQVDELLQHVGDANGDGTPNTTADVKTMLGKMRQMCVEAGFGGLVIATEYRGRSNAEIKKICDSGFDYVYAYTWHPTANDMTNDEMLENIQRSLNVQRDAASRFGDTQVIPNISKMWDPEPWVNVGFSTAGPTYQFDLAHYKELMEWVKNEYGAPVIDPEGHKMYMFDNWNEFGEGHHLQPTYGAPAYKDGKVGFGYLDVIRDVFGTTPYDYQHNDLAPLEEGYGPYDKWYPAGWDDPQDPGLNPIDTSISDSVPNTDKEIGNNTMGGTTNLALESDNALLDYSDSNRVIVTQEVLQSLVREDKDVIVKMKEGCLHLPIVNLSKLSETGGLDLIINRQIDITEAKGYLRADGYRPYDRRVYDIRVLQSENDVADIVGATVKLPLDNAVSLKEKGAVIQIGADGKLNDAKSSFTEDISFSLRGNSLYAIIKK